MRTIDRSQQRDATEHRRRRAVRGGCDRRRGDRERTRLSDDQRDLAASAWEGVSRVAGAFARTHPQLRDEFFSDAAMRLLDAVRGYDPEKTPDFGLYARHVVRLAMISTLRRSGDWRRRRTIGDGDRVNSRVRRTISDTAASGGHCPVEEADAFDRLVRVVPGRGGDALALVYRDGLTHEEAGARLGVTGRTIDKDLALALARIRESLAS